MSLAPGKEKNMDSKMIREAQDLLRKAMENLKKNVSKELGNTPHLEGVRPMEGSVRCGVVSFPAIAASPGFVLSPDYYLQGCQTEAVSSYLLADGLSFDTFMERLGKCITEKAVTVRGNRTFLNPNTVATLERIQAELA